MSREKDYAEKLASLLVKFVMTLTIHAHFFGRCTVAQSVEHPSKVPVRCNSADVGSNHVRHTSSLSLSLSDHAVV